MFEVSVTPEATTRNKRADQRQTQRQVITLQMIPQMVPVHSQATPAVYSDKYTVNLIHFIFRLIDLISALKDLINIHVSVMPLI